MTPVETKAWTEVKNLHDLTQAGALPLEYRFTLSQKAAFQLEEQLQVAYTENLKLQVSMQRY